MKTGTYENALGISSQFYHCALPLRLDAYSRCQFACQYCFAHARGGDSGPLSTRTGDPDALARRFDRTAARGATSVVDEFLLRRQPIHFGGMSDPFMPLERRLKVSLGYLRVLSERRYPCVISTKSSLLGTDEYLSALQAGNFLVQVSVSSLDARLLSTIDRGTPGPTEILRMVRLLANEGISTAIRIQPVLPGREFDAAEVIDAAADAGARHVSVEHLKLPIERGWSGAAVMDAALGHQLRAHYLKRGANRVGREWVLPVADRLPRIIQLRDRAWSRGLTFGAADTDLLPLGDGSCCCSGADLTAGFDSFYRYTFAEAVKRGLSTGTFSRSSIESEWRPRMTIARFVNSKSRLSSKEGAAGVKGYVDRNWNGSCNGSSPAAFWGVSDTGYRDPDGFAVYQVSSELRTLARMSDNNVFE